MKKLLMVLAVVMCAGTAVADTCSANLTGRFTPEEAKKLCTTFLGTATLSADLLPGADGSYDLGSSSYEFQDGFFDGTLTTDALVNSGTSTLTGNVTTSGEVILDTSGKTLSIQEATSGAKCMGSVTANGTTAVTVSTTCATTGSRIFLTPTSDPTGSTAAYCWATNIVNGTSFDVDCDQANDGTLNWIIFHEAP